MRFSSSLLCFVSLAALYHSEAAATAASTHSKLPISKASTHRRHLLSRGRHLDAYHPKASYETWGAAGTVHVASDGHKGAGREDTSRSFVAERHGLKAENVFFHSKVTTDVGEHAYLHQQHDGIKFANARASVAYNKQGKVVATGSSFVKDYKSIASSKPSRSEVQSIKVAETTLDGSHNGHPVALSYLVTESHDVVLTHTVQIRDEKAGTWYQAYVNAHTGDLVSISDFKADATYKVLPIIEEYPSPESLQTLVDPEDLNASPWGWTSFDGETTTGTTSGNNAFAHRGGSHLFPKKGKFVFDWNDKRDPKTFKNVASAITNAFYVVNRMHDILYLYGFTESAFNFQAVNIADGGEGGDAVEIKVQSDTGTDNANFYTPPDGQSGVMQMYIWTATTPNRDSAMENDVVIHEFGHGVSNRLTGGGTGECLQTLEAGGMGEGWSDALANWVHQFKHNGAVKDFVMGEYLQGGPGIRSHPYSTSATVNPQRYSDLKAIQEEHSFGEIWANMLHNVYADMVQAYGWESSAIRDASSTAGNAKWLHLFIDSLMLQPCHPTMVAARDAWIQADSDRYGGESFCLLWKAFASRGLGVNAADFEDDDSVPKECS